MNARTLFDQALAEGLSGVRLPDLRPSTLARAELNRMFARTDRSMWDQLMSEGCPGDNATVGLCDENGDETQTLDQASPKLRSAYSWLAERGYVRLTTDKYGQLIEILKEVDA